MREDDSNWFSRWEEKLPSPEELMPLSQTLISPDLAIAFDIRHTSHHNQQQQQQIPHPQPSSSNPLPSPGNLPQPSSVEFADSAELDSGTAGEEPARTLKRPRLVWTPQLHKRFVDAVAHLGIKNAVPKTIMQLMSVDGLTRENVASHLQKYRLYLKRMQGLPAGGGGVAGGGAAYADPATDHLFASSPVPPHFLHTAVARTSSDHFSPFVPVPALQHHHHQQQMAVAAAAAASHPQYHRQVGHFGSPPNGHFELPFLSRQNQRMGAPVHNPVPGYMEDLESGNASGGRKVLTLFPTGDD